MPWALQRLTVSAEHVPVQLVHVPETLYMPAGQTHEMSLEAVHAELAIMPPEEQVEQGLQVVHGAVADEQNVFTGHGEHCVSAVGVHGTAMYVPAAHLVHVTGAVAPAGQ